MSDFMHLWEQMGTLAKAVIVVLGIQSVWSVSVMIERYILYRKARNQSREFAPVVAEALGKGSLEEAVGLAEQYQASHLAKVVHAGLQEFRAHSNRADTNPNVISGEVIDASRRAIQRAQAVGVEDFKRGLGALATIGATAPFVGLFGTTVGVINAFAGMSAGEDVGLAAVAGGISEALVATALGLFVAIPAVWMYNYFTGKVESFVVEMDNSASELIDYFVSRRGEAKKHGS
jgi:biopolymer transport protein ExbB/TolQ